MSRDGIYSNDNGVAALSRVPMSTDIRQLRYYRKFPPNMVHRIRSITTFLKNGATFRFISAMEDTVRALLTGLTKPLTLVIFDWDKSRSFHLHCDASTGGVGATV